MKIASVKYPGWNMQAGEMHQLLGFKSSKLPKDFETQTAIVDANGVTHELLVTPSRPSQGKSSKHRIFVKCTCARLIPFGRMHQHKH